MTIQDYLRLVKSRWITLCATVLAAVVVAVAVTLLTTPLYQADTRLFVSTTASASLADNYQGNRLSQERVVSYAELIMGRTLAQRTIDKLGLDTDVASLQERIKATAKPDTVLIDVTILDKSPVLARDIANTLSDEFVLMVRGLETPADGSVPDARVVVEQRASLPDHPVIPKPGRNIALGLVVGIILGIILAVTRELLDNTVKDQQSLDQITGVGLVGTIPLDKDRRKEPAITFDDNSSAIAEAFRKLRTNLQFLSVDDPPRVIVVTSSVPSEGKSTTAINIALVLAEAGNSVVLVDGDMRLPTLDKYLNMVGSVGLSTVLSGQASLTEVLQETAFARLTVLASGVTPPNPSELLGTVAAKKVILELRSKYDYVIVDSSPLLAVTDASIWATNADGVLLIARYGHTKREQLTHAVRNITDVGARLLGAVFTMTPVRGGSGYGYAYGYGYNNAPTLGRDRGPSRTPDENQASTVESSPNTPG